MCRDITGYELTVPGNLSSVVAGTSAITGNVDASCPYGDTSQAGNPLSGDAEAVRADPGATRDALQAQMKKLEAINLMHGG